MMYYGDVLEQLRKIPSKSIDCVITSPPYYGLRDYGHAGQWGLEKYPELYLAHLKQLLDESWRVLKPTGSVWINLGDTYAGSGKGAGKEKNKYKETPETIPDKKFDINEDVRRKSKLLIPERFVVMAVMNNWICRNDVIWYKRNRMPSSVKDRLTNSFEHIYHLVKSPKYYYNLDAIRQPCVGTPTKSFNRDVRDQKKGRKRAGELMRDRSDKEMDQYDDKGIKKQDNYIVPSTGRPDATKMGFNDRYNNHRKSAHIPGPKVVQSLNLRHSGNYDMITGECLNHPKGKNPGDMWDITVKPYKGSHYATFPIDIPLRTIQATCPPDGTVLDPFMGSGTTAAAATKLGRKWIGIDIDRRNQKLIEERIAKTLEQIK